MQPGDPWLRPFDWCAVALLGAGCLSGILALLLQATPPAPLDPAEPAAPAAAIPRTRPS